MYKATSILVASSLALLGASSLAGAARSGSAPRSGGAARHSAVTVIPVLGPAVNVAPGEFVKAYAMCPKGYYVTGGGAYSGAITEIVSSPTKEMRGWFVDGTNDDPLKRTFQHRADAVCVKGSSAVSVGAAAASDEGLVHQAEVEFRLSHQASHGG
jgi:hypothetical protein